MENNIFMRLKKDKYNPDIEPKLKNKETERNNTKFNLSTNIYNPITGIIPNEINNSNDLILTNTNTNVDFNQLIASKENERKQQMEQLKPIKTKVINNEHWQKKPLENNIEIKTNEQIHDSINRTNYIETYEDLKRGSLNIIHQQKTIKQNDNYNSILEGLKDLGIIK